MAKLTRYVQKVFGSAASTNEMSEYGSFAAGAPLRYSGATITPDIVQALSEYLSGWKSAVVGNNSPLIEDMNSLCFLFGYQLTYLFQTGIPEWNTDTIYYIGSLVNDGAGTIYKSITNANAGNALTSVANWAPIWYGSQVTTKTTTATIGPTEQFVRCTTSGSDYTVTLTAVASCPAGQLVEIKNCTDVLNTVTVAAAGAELIDFANTLDLGPGQSCRLFNNGTNWDIR